MKLRYSTFVKPTQFQQGRRTRLRDSVWYSLGDASMSYSLLCTDRTTRWHSGTGSCIPCELAPGTCSQLQFLTVSCTLSCVLTSCYLLQQGEKSTRTADSTTTEGGMTSQTGRAKTTRTTAAGGFTASPAARARPATSLFPATPPRTATADRPRYWFLLRSNTSTTVWVYLNSSLWGDFSPFKTIEKPVILGNVFVFKSN